MFSFLDLILLISSCQGVFIIFGLHFIQQKNKAANQILIALLGISSLMLLGRVSFYKIENDILWRIGLLADVCIFLCGPLFYLYIHKLSLKAKKYGSFIHFIPAILHFSYFTTTLFTTKEEFNAQHLNGELFYTFVIVELTGLLSLCFYSIKSLFLFISLKDQKNKELSFDPKFLKYINALLIVIFSCCILWIISFISCYILGEYNPFLNYNTLWIFVSAIFYIIGFYSFSQPQLFRMEEKPVVSLPTLKKQRLSEKEITRYCNLVSEKIKVDKLFTKPELSLQHFAKAIEITPNNLSWLLNEVYQQNFYSFINEYRIQEFIDRVKKGQHKKQTILAIALDVGFNSKSTFNKFFKATLNQTPSEYIRTVSTEK